MSEIHTVEVEQAIVHLLDREEGLMLSNHLLPLNPDMRTYLGRLVWNGLRDRHTQMAQFADKAPDSVAALCSQVVDGDLSLVEGSRLLAHRLFAIMSVDRRTTTSNLVACFYRPSPIAAYRHLGLFLLGSEAALSVSFLDEPHGRHDVAVAPRAIGLPARVVRLNKSAFIRTCVERGEYDMLLLDRQALREDPRVARFFSDLFMGAAPIPRTRGRGQVQPSSSVEGGPAAAAQAESTTDGLLFVCARWLEAFWGRLPLSHLSLVMRGSDGTETEYEGQPERQTPGAFGRIVVVRHPYRPRPDRRNVRVPLASGAVVLNARVVLDAELERLNSAAIPYDLFGPNSNTVARSLLLRLALEPLQPAALAPGFEHDAL